MITLYFFCFLTSFLLHAAGKQDATCGAPTVTLLKFARLAISSQFLLGATVLVVRVLIEEFLEERFADNLDDGQLRISWHSCCQAFMRQRTDEH